MPEISHVRIAVPEQATLNRILREGGAQSFPQWLYAEPGDDSRILWWGLRAPIRNFDAPPRDDARFGLFPRLTDDWTEPPRGLVLVTTDLDRAIEDLARPLGDGWHDAGEDAILGASCRRIDLGRSDLVLAQPSGEGYAAACLAKFGEGPMAVALDGTAATGRRANTNPVSGGAATYLRIGGETAPTFIFLPAST